MSRPYRLDVRYREQLGALHTTTRREVLCCLLVMCSACADEGFRVTNERELNIVDRMIRTLEKARSDPEEIRIEPTIRLQGEVAAPPPVPVPPQPQQMPQPQQLPNGQYYPQHNFYDGNPTMAPPAWFLNWLAQQGPPTPVLRRTTTSVGVWNSPSILRSPLRTP